MARDHQEEPRCTHLIVGRDHAGPGSDSKGTPFYGPYDAQELLKRHEEELGIAIVPFKLMVYAPEHDTYYAVDEVPEGVETVNISGTEQRRRLQLGIELPSWFTFPDVEAELRKSSPSRHQQGFTVFLTGLSGSGKSTIANALMAKLLEMGGRLVTLLDGDLVRKNLSQRVGLLQGAPRHQYTPHRLRRERDYQERRHRRMCADRALRGGAAGSAQDGPVGRRLHSGPRRHSARRVRATGPQGPLRKGAGGHHQGVHRHNPIPTRSPRTPKS